MNLFKKSTEQEIKETVEKATAKLKDLAREAQTKYQQADEQTKKKIIAAVAGATVIIAAAIGVKKMMKKK